MCELVLAHGEEMAIGGLGKVNMGEHLLVDSKNKLANHLRTMQILYARSGTCAYLMGHYKTKVICQQH